MKKNFRYLEDRVNAKHAKLEIFIQPYLKSRIQLSENKYKEKTQPF